MRNINTHLVPRDMVMTSAYIDFFEDSFKTLILDMIFLHAKPDLIEV